MPDVMELLSDYQYTPDLAHAATLPARWYTDPAYLALEKERARGAQQSLGLRHDVERPPVSALSIGRHRKLQIRPQKRQLPKISFGLSAYVGPHR